MLADASPIAMREWLVAEIFFIKNKQLRDFYKAANDLVLSTLALLAGEDIGINRTECDKDYSGAVKG